MSALPDHVKAMLWMSAAVLCLTLMEALLKLAALGLPPMLAITIRMVFGVLMLAPWILRDGIGSLKTSRPGTHFWRGVIGYLGLTCFILAATRIPLADVTAISFTRPLWAILIAAIVLREAFDGRRGLATLIGFSGVLIMVRPDGALEVRALLALGHGFFSGLTIVFVRTLSSTEPPVRIMFYHQALSVVLGLGPALYYWQTPGLESLLWIAGSAVFGTAGHWCFARAAKLGEASVIAPMEYTRLPAAAAIGFWLFAELPTVWTFVGAGVIAAATLYIARRESQLARERGT
jgi:drug/metabolite transporter (DMT)-like permease